MRRQALLLISATLSVTMISGARQPQPWAGDRFDVMEKSILELQDAMQRGVVRAVDLVDVYLTRIEAFDRSGPRINSIVTLNPRARDEASALDAERARRGPRGPLHGIPVVVKDNFDVAGLPTMAGTIAFTNLYPADDAFQVKRLREAGAVVLAKTNLHELASGITTIGSAAGQTLNPYDLGRNPGGSSGGTGAAVASNFAAAGLGSDTCGSIRIPASHNALVGLRGTYGLSSRDGVVPLSHSQDVAGPLARSITDLAIVLDATVGFDPDDETTKSREGERPGSYRDALTAGALKSARIGVLTSFFGTAPEDNEAGGIVRRAIDEMKKQAVVIDVTIPGLDDQLRGSSVIDMEFKEDLAAYLAKVPNAPVKSLGDILDRGLFHQAVEAALRRRNRPREEDAYRRTLVRRAAVRAAVLSAIEEHRLDALVYPTMRRKPAIVGEPQPGSTCLLSAATGLPALSVPAGFTDDRLPIGLELLGPAFSEARLLALGYAWEQTGKVRRPPFSAPALIGRAAPPSMVFTTIVPPALAVRFSFDPPSGDLTYSASINGVAAADVVAVWVHRTSDQRGGALYQLVRRGEIQGTGTFRLRPAEQVWLRDGGLSLVLYTKQGAGGELRARMRLE